ncbi:MAG TPA: RNA-binding protein [Thermoanaerobaculia bacterium]|nr:RNA-binding protein [Thermoanaerobaculia bacterium]
MKLHIGNLSKDVTDAEFNDMVSQFGPTTSVELIKDRQSGESKGFGFAEYGDDEHARAAITALNGKEVGGATLKVSEARPRKN